MLNDYVRPEQPSKEDVRERVRTEQSKLSTYGMKIKEAKLPVMVIFEGWGSSGKGSAIAANRSSTAISSRSRRPASLSSTTLSG